MSVKSWTDPDMPALQHVSLIVSDVDVSRHFYCAILGFTEDNSRPDMAFAGAWLEAGQSLSIHLIELPNMDPTTGRPEHGGRDRHVAFSTRDIDALKQILETNDIDYTMSSSGRQALFCRDPDGNALEFIQAS